MSYLSHHHGSYWFQLRVPAPLVPRYSQLVRINLQTQDRVAAQHQAYQLVGYWLARFHAERHGSPCAAPTPPAPQPPEIATFDPPAESMPLTKPVVTGCSYDDLYASWKRLDPDRDPTILREMKAIAWDWFVLRRALGNNSAGCLDILSVGNVSVTPVTVCAPTGALNDVYETARLQVFLRDPRQHHALVDARALRAAEMSVECTQRLDASITSS